MRGSTLKINSSSLSFPKSIKARYTASAPPPQLPAQSHQLLISHLRQCTAAKSIAATRRLHQHMKRSGFPYLSLGNKLVDAYLKCGSIEHAREVFDEMPHPHIVSWNSLISSYIRRRRSREALMLHRRMLREGVVPDEFTFSSIFRAFSDLGLVRQGRGAHGLMVVLGLKPESVFVGSALVHMYAKFIRLGEARLFYDEIKVKDVVLVTALIVGYTQNGEDSEAIRVFEGMAKDGVKANEFTFASVLIACGNLRELRKGTAMHGLISKLGLDTGTSSQTSLLSMYSKCGLIDDSLRVFHQIVNPNTVTWTAMIGCLHTNHREEQALSMFRCMIDCSVEVNEFTLSTVLRVCSSLALFQLGKLIHAHSMKIGLDIQKFVGAALIDLYGKCGHVRMSRLVFDNVAEMDLVSVNSMICGYAQNSYGVEAIKLFDSMHNFGLEPNEMTFTGILSACSITGHLEEGRRIFSSITTNYKFGPTNEHYACMVDLLGRAGRLSEAVGLISQVPKPDKVLWRALLGACKIHGELEMAKLAAKRVLELDPCDDATHVLLSNIYASLNQWEEVSSMKSKMRGMRLKKGPAMSWVEVNKEMHTFMAGDWAHSQSAEIYKELERLIDETKVLGYVPDTRFVLQELDELEKERSLYYHSEKLAVAFGVLSGEGDKSGCIMVFKNLRVCGDCHNWMKLVSKVVGKEIITRDSKRFHHFRDGLCSCRDYW